MKNIYVLLLILFPSVAFAQSTLVDIVNTVRTILDRLIPVLITLAIVYFFWGLAKFILAAGDASKQAEGKSVMVWGVIALFVMVSVWGLVAVLQGTFETTGDARTIPLNDSPFF